MGESFIGGLLGGAGGAALGTLYVKLAADSIELVKGMAEAELSVKHGAEGMLKSVGGLATVMTGALTLIGGVAIEEFSKFEKAITKATATMGGVSKELRKEMEDTARAIARTNDAGAQELADAYNVMAKAGLNAQQSIAVLAKVEEFSTATATDMITATNLLIGAQTGLGMRVKDVNENMENTVRISDVFVKAGRLASASTTDFAEALNTRLGDALRNTNKSVEEGVAALAALSDRNIKGADAGEALGMALRELQRTAIENRDIYAKVGIAVFDASGKMRNMADIVKDFEKSLQGASTEQKRAALEMLGFQSRSLSATTALIGTSDKIREYETALRSAGGTTEEVAKIQMESFHNQLNVTIHLFEDMLLSIGEGLMPAMKELNEMLQELTRSNSSANESLKESASIIGGALVAVAKSVGFLWNQLKDFLKFLSVGILSLVEMMIKASRAIAQGVATVVNTMVEGILLGINLVIGEINTAIAKLPQWVKDKTGLSQMGMLKIPFTLKFDSSVSDEWLATLKGAKEEIRDSLVKTWEDAAEAVKKPAEEINEHLKKAGEAGAEGMKKVEDGAKGAMTQLIIADTAAKALALQMDKLTKITGIKSPMEEMGLTRQDLKDLGVSERTAKSMEIPRMPPTLMGTDPATQQAMQTQLEISAAQDKLKILQEIGENDVKLNQEVLDRKQAAIEAYNQKLKQLHQAQALVIVSASQEMFDSLGNAVAGFAGKQSNAYKAMFAASKAFAIAESIIKIQQGIANAAALPWPANLAAIASVVTATANIVSTIQSIKLELDGKKAAGGPVGAGGSYLVGERGPEVFSPASNGTIVPNSQIGQSVKVIVNNYTDAQASVSERMDGSERIVEVVVKRIKNEIGSEVRDGRGEISKAMESSWGLRRGTK